MITKENRGSTSAIVAGMQGFEPLFRGKKITMLGLGLLGRGVGDAEFLALCGAEVTVTDTKTESELAESVGRLKHFANITFHLGGHREEDFTNADLVIKAAGVRLDSPEVAVALSAGVPVSMSTALFAKYASEAGVKIVGVTGTRGKSTISHMIFHVLKSAGRRVHLGGNVRGISTLAMLPEVQPGDVAVLELDSWQLQGFGELEMSPHVAVFTNLMPDHQNYYTSMDEYFADKANIFRFQHPGDALVVGHSVEDRVRAASASWRTPVDLTVPGDLPKDWQLNIPGGHNRYNASLASSALLALGLTADAIHAGLETFDGVEGRLQLVGEKGGVKIYNDNNATTPEATIAALRALHEGERNSLILIAGGSDKGLDLTELVSEIQKTCKAVMLLAGTGTDTLKEKLHAAEVFQNLNTAVDAAFAVATPGDTILFSPAFASFGMFKNEYDRNDQFLALIKLHL
ncbi:MAG: UDP-N-acetylmuramoylalanine--D-glutamate ligase [Parcubacteria group bacterium Athens0416_74]|nr:MAG: UDP-N-acetylmuramoylalanine--D-glutamate ligase [Parcubacteria group bacterium Athens0416_74]